MLRLLILLTYCAALLLLAFLPPVPMPVQASGSDLKLHHVVALVVLTILTWWYVEQKPSTHPILRTILVAFSFGALIELVQLTIPYRTGRWQDLISNAIGILIGLAAIYAIRGKKRCGS